MSGTTYVHNNNWYSMYPQLYFVQPWWRPGVETHSRTLWGESSGPRWILSSKDQMFNLLLDLQTLDQTISSCEFAQTHFFSAHQNNWLATAGTLEK